MAARTRSCTSSIPGRRCTSRTCSTSPGAGATTSVALEHISFGSVLGNDRKPIKTREGGAVELGELLDEAVRRGASRCIEAIARNALARGEEVPELSRRRAAPDRRGRSASAPSSTPTCRQNRDSDYVFNWDKMLAMDGNTATYMQYAYARNRGIFRKGDVDAGAAADRAAAACSWSTPQERAWRCSCCASTRRWPPRRRTTGRTSSPPTYGTWPRRYSGFFQNCPVLKAETPALRQSRLLLCDLTARVIQHGLDLLGIRTVERM